MTAALDRRIAKMAGQGKSEAEIAAACLVSLQRVRAALPKRDVTESGVTIPEPEPIVDAVPARPFVARYPEPALCATPGCRYPRQPGRDICADCHTRERVPLKPVVNRAPAPYPHHRRGPKATAPA